MHGKVFNNPLGISIHALREESDTFLDGCTPFFIYFNPRSP